MGDVTVLTFIRMVGNDQIWLLLDWTYEKTLVMCALCNKVIALQWRIQGGVRGVQIHPPFEGLPSRVLSKPAQT